MKISKPDGWLELSPSGKGKPVLVLHAWWGLNDTIKSICTSLAESGFTAFAPDLYHGKVAEDIPGAEALSDTLNPDRAKADIKEAVSYLDKLTDLPNQSVSVIGFSLGAFFALDLSTADPNVRSVVIFYGIGFGHFKNSKAAYLGHFAEEDEYEPQSEVNNLESELRKAGCPVNFHIYPGTGHWFFEPDRSHSYNQAAADLAWARTLAFLERATSI